MNNEDLLSENPFETLKRVNQARIDIETGVLVFPKTIRGVEISEKDFLELLEMVEAVAISLSERFH